MNMHHNGSTGMLSTSGFCNNAMPMAMQMHGFQSAWNVGVDQGCLIYIFSGLVIDSKSKYLVALVGTFLFAFAVEGFGFLRKMYSARFTPEVALGRPITTLNIRHFVPSIHYALQMAMAYMCMLVVMMYESWFLTVLILGLAVGHTVFTVVLPVKCKHLITPKRAYRLANENTPGSTAFTVTKRINASESDPSSSVANESMDRVFSHGDDEKAAPLVADVATHSPCCRMSH